MVWLDNDALTQFETDQWHDKRTCGYRNWIKVVTKKLFLAAVWIFVGLFGAAGQVVAQTYITPQSFVSGSAGAGGVSRFQYANGVTVTFQTQENAAVRYRVRAANSTLGAIGTPAAGNFYAPATAATLGSTINIWGAGCATPGTGNANGVICTNRGTMTVTFSEPVTNPIIHFGGLGNREDVVPAAMRYNAVYRFSSALNGGTAVTPTLTEMAGNGRFAIAGNDVGNQGAMAGLSTSCTTNEAACGSVRINGTITQVVFTVVLRTYGSLGFQPSTTNDAYSDGHSISASIPSATLRLRKALPTGRAIAGNQFTLDISNGATVAATVTTTGATTTPTQEATLVVNPSTGTTYTLSEAAAGSPLTVLANYVTTYACTNARVGAPTPPSGSGTSFSVTLVEGDDLTCTFTNTRKQATLTLTKISQGGARAFTFTGNNGWTSQTLTTTVPGVGVTGAPQTLTALDTATTITETMPPGFVLTGVACSGMGPGGAVTTGASSFTLNAAAVAADSQIACTVTNSVQSQTPFPTCPSGMYLSQSPDVTTNTTLYDINTGTNPFTYPALGQGSIVYNAIGFNPLDNFIYGINAGTGSGNRLIRVGANGSTVDLGPVAGMAASNWITGTFSDTGVLYVLAGGGSTNLRAINVQTNTSTLITLSSSVQASDMAWIGGLIYTVQGNGQLRSINPVTGAVINIGVSSGAVDYGAMFGSPTGLFGSANGGGFYRFDLATGARTLISDSPASNVNDGASCPTALITFAADLAVTKTNTPAQGPNDLPTDPYVPGEVRTYSIVVTNLGPFGMQNASVSDPLPAGVDALTASWACATTSGGAVCGAASGTGALNDTGLNLPPAAVATYLLTLTVPTGFTGVLSNTVTVTPPTNINDANTGNNTATDVDTQATANLSITKASTTSPVVSGGMVTYTIVATNNGPAAADNAVVMDDWTSVPGLDCSTATGPGVATCAASGTAGTACPAPASVTPEALQAGLAIPAFPSGGIVTFTLQCTVTATGL